MRTEEFLTLGDSFTRENIKERLIRDCFHRHWGIYYIGEQEYPIENIEPLVEVVYDEDGQRFAEDLKDFLQKRGIIS
jgi:hypothetical protein